MVRAERAPTAPTGRWWPSAGAAPWGRRLAASHTAALAVVWVAAALYLLRFVDRGWLPGDEGLLGQTAERVLAGELPHRDFDDTYTGGLAFLHAGAFRLLGADLVSLRWLLFAATLVFVPVVYRLAARRASPWVAAGVTALCVVWSVPNYFAGLPSWYNLYLATGAVLALVRLVESGRTRWAFVAGLCGGVSITLKSAGLLHVAAVLLFLVLREKVEDEAATAATATPPSGARSRGFSLLVTLGLFAFVAVLTAFFSQRDREMDVLLFVVPGAALATVLAIGEWRTPSGPVATRLRRLAGMAGPFLLGVALPIGAFLLPYLARSGLGDWLAGDFLFPRSRLDYAAWDLPPLASVVCVVPLLVLLAAPWERLAPSPLLRRLLVALAVVGLAAVVLRGDDRYVYQTVWYGVRPLVPVLTLLGCAALLRGRPRDPKERQCLFLLLAMSSLFSTVQFTYSLGIYFCYAAPLVVLAYLYFVRSQPAAPLAIHGALMGFFAIFAVVWMNPGVMQGLGVRYIPIDPDTPLELPRASLRVAAEEATLYRGLVEIVRHRSTEGSYVWCSPDCPEVAFLAGRRSPTRTFADFLDADYGTPERTARLLRTLDEKAVEVVVLNWRPSFSRLDPELWLPLMQRYPWHRAVGSYTVHWRETAPSEGVDGRGPPRSPETRPLPGSAGVSPAPGL